MTPDEAEALFDQAFKLERRGEHEAAIEIYDRLGKELVGQQGAEYAANCASKLRRYESLAGPRDPKVEGDYWCDGELLVVRNGATLPKRCIKTNTTERLRQSKLNLMYMPFAQWILVSGLPLAHILINPTKIRIRVSLNHKYWLLRNLARLGFWLLLPIFVLCIFGFVFTEDSTLRVICAILAAIIFISARVVDSFLIDPVRVKWVRGSFAGLKRANSDYLAELPKWPFVWGDSDWRTGSPD